MSLQMQLVLKGYYNKEQGTNTWGAFELKGDDHN